MPQISFIKYKDIIEARRYDAEYYKPDYLQIEKLLNNTNSTNFENYIKLITDGKHGGVTFTEKGVRFLRNTNIKEFFIDESEILHISEEESIETLRAEITPGNLLFTSIGTIGQTLVVPQEIPRANINQNLVKIVLKSNYSPYFLAVFLNSKYGKYQSIRLGGGNVQGIINYSKIKKIKVYYPENIIFTENIENSYKNAFQTFYYSKQLYKEAEEILLNEIFGDCRERRSAFPTHLWFTTTKKEIDKAKRYDSEYFQPKYAEIIKKIEEYEGGWDYAGKIVNWKKGIEVGTDAYTDTGKDFVRVSDFSINGISETNRKISESAYLELKDNFQPKKDDILFTKDGTIGISYVLKEDIEGVLSGAFLRLNLTNQYKEFEKECLSLIFNSIICKMQVEKLSGGALIDHLKPSDFETFKIPLIKPEIQKQIADKIKESHKLRKESKELLETAKRAVEIAIEENEEKAMEYLNK